MSPIEMKMLGSQEGARGASGRPVPADDARAGLLLVDAEPAIQAAVQAALRSSDVRFAALPARPVVAVNREYAELELARGQRG